MNALKKRIDAAISRIDYDSYEVVDGKAQAVDNCTEIAIDFAGGLANYLNEYYVPHKERRTWYLRKSLNIYHCTEEVIEHYITKIKKP